MKKLSRAALFVSFKTIGAIPIGQPLRRDFLIQSTLDAGVRSIDFHPTVIVDDRVVRADTIVVDRDDGRYVVDFLDERLPESADRAAPMHVGFQTGSCGILAIANLDTRREPRFSAAREVWRYSDINVFAGDRAQIMDALDNEGPFPLRGLDGLVTTRRDAVEVVYALACEGSVSLDLRRPLDGHAIVRAGIRYSSPRHRFGT